MGRSRSQTHESAGAPSRSRPRANRPCPQRTPSGGAPQRAWERREQSQSVREVPLLAQACNRIAIAVALGVKSELVIGCSASRGGSLIVGNIAGRVVAHGEDTSAGSEVDDAQKPGCTACRGRHGRRCCRARTTSRACVRHGTPGERPPPDSAGSMMSRPGSTGGRLGERKGLCQ